MKFFFHDLDLFSECAMFIRDRRNTNLTKNIMMAATVTMNTTLGNAEVLDQLLIFIFKNWDVTQFIILLIIKQLPPIIIHLQNFLVFLLKSALLFWFFLLSFHTLFLNFHSFLALCSPHICHYVIFNRDLIFDSLNVFQKKKLLSKIS